MAMENNKCIFGHESCRFLTLHKSYEPGALSRAQFERRRELLFR